MILTDKRLFYCAHAINAKVLSALLGLVDQGVDGGAGGADGKPLDPILAHVGDIDEGANSRGVTAIRFSVGPDNPNTFNRIINPLLFGGL